MSRTLVDDLVSGIVGIFEEKELAPGQDRNKYIIWYKSAKMFGWWQGRQKIPAAIPIEGMVEVPGTQCADGNARIIIFSYGNDTVHPPLIPYLIEHRIGDTIRAMDQLSSTVEQKDEALSAQERAFARNKEETVEKFAEAADKLNTRKRDRREGFISRGLGED
jgi:hypothetical protein